MDTLGELLFDFISLDLSGKSQKRKKKKRDLYYFLFIYNLIILQEELKKETLSMHCLVCIIIIQLNITAELETLFCLFLSEF